MFFDSNTSSSTTHNTTRTQQGTVQGNDGDTTSVVGDGNTVLDGGIVKKAFDFADGILKTLTSSEANALEHIETISKDSNKFISDYAKNSSERIFENLTTYGGIALVLGVGVWVYKGLE